MLPPDLKRLDTHGIPEDKSEIRLFGVVRNESLRMPYFLDYYRRMGVMRFFIVDNDSQDGTTEFLLAQPDCCVFHTKGSYAATRFGLGWINPVMSHYGDGHWIILADADEILVSSTVRDLVIGSGIEFDTRGAHTLKGVPAEWALFAVKT